jgi:hypothetical protein
MSKLRVLLKGGYAFGVEADQYAPQKRSGNFGSDVALMSFTKRGDEVCAVLLSELAAIVMEEHLVREPSQMADGAVVMAPMPSHRRSSGRSRSAMPSNGNGKAKHLVRSRR